MRSQTARVLIASALVLAPAIALAGSPGRTLAVDAHQWRVIPRESGPDNYYTVVTDDAADPPFVRGRYHPPQQTAVLGFQIPGDVQSKAQTVRWRWRVQTLPPGANECAKGKEDSAAVVYLTWKRALKWYTLKYVWSTVGPKGQTCDKHGTPFSAQETVILQSGGPTGTWQTEEIDLPTEFRRHFAGGDPSASVPDFIGIGLMTDGDQTKSEAVADYAGFEIGW
jgi:hypothetical protein